MADSHPIAPRSIAAVIVSYNTRDLLARCLESLGDQLRDDDRIVVVDNDSSDGSADMVASDFPSVRLIRSGANLGFGKGCNLGAGEFPDHDVLMFNPDAVAFAGMLDALHDAQVRLPEAGVLGGRSVMSDGSTDPRSCWGFPSPWSAFCFASGLSTVFKRTALFDPESIPGWDRDTERKVDMVSGALMLVARPLWDALSGFDERFFMYGEDLDLCRRAHELGATPTMVPDAVMRHDVGSSSTGAGKKVLLLRGKVTAALEHHSVLSGRFMQGCYVFGTGVRALLSVAARRQTAWRSAWPQRREWMDGYPRLSSR